MNAKTTEIELVRVDTGAVVKFEISHAERLLRMKPNGGWQLCENSSYNFDEENGITRKRNKDKGNGAKEARND